MENLIKNYEALEKFALKQRNEGKKAALKQLKYWAEDKQTVPLEYSRACSEIINFLEKGIIWD